MPPVELLLPLLLAVPEGVVPESRPAEAPCHVARVEVVRHTVFDTEDGAGGWPLRLANRLHVCTREPVIRREILFSAGESYEPELLAQTERNLRDLGFLREARVESRPATGGDGHDVDVSVHTFDSWSTSPELKLAKVGNRWVWALGISETNLLGRGQAIDVSRRQDLDRQETHVGLSDPRLFDSRVAGRASYADRSDGRWGELELKRPFFAMASRWGLSARFEGFDQLDPIYAEGERVADLRHIARRGEFELARTLRHRERTALRLQTAYRYQDDQVTGCVSSTAGGASAVEGCVSSTAGGASAVEGDRRRFGIVELGLQSVRNRFVQLTHVNRFEATEDFNLGNQAELAVGLSTPALGGEPGNVVFLRVSEAVGVPLGPAHFTRLQLSWSGRHRRGRLENGHGELRLDYLNRLAPRVLALGIARYRHGTRLDPEVQVSLGAHNGLRGHPVRQWVGNRSLLLTGELRLFIADEIFQLVSFGLAAFVDSGYAWPDGDAVALRDLKTNVGLGLLVGRNRLSSRRAALRLDLAYAFQPAAGRSHWVLSAGSGLGF